MSLSIEQAIELIKSKYEDNQAKNWIRDPVAYTLYEVWKIVDSKSVLYPSNKGDL